VVAASRYILASEDQLRGSSAHGKDVFGSVGASEDQQRGGGGGARG
jgi:hypothetical protein